MDMHPLRILHVVESLDRGGLERMVVDLTLEQSRRGHQVTVATLYRPGALAQELHGTLVQTLDCGKQSQGGLHAFGHLRRRISAGLDVVHSHNPMSHYYATSAAFGLPRTARINTRHGMGPGANASRRLEWLYARSLARTDAVATVCEAARRRFLARHSSRPWQWVTLRNGIDLARVLERNEIHRQTLLAELGIASSSCIIGCVGRLNPVKQHQTLLQAFAQILPANPHACLVVVGDGPEHARLVDIAAELGISNAVRFLGARNDVPRLLAGMDAFALTSASEGYSLALVEASAAGLPIVASNVGGNGEIVIDEVSGKLFPPGDINSCATCLHALAASPDLRERLGTRARHWALENASMQTMADAYEALYRGAMPPNGHRKAASISTPAELERTT